MERRCDRATDGAGGHLPVTPVELYWVQRLAMMAKRQDLPESEIPPDTAAYGSVPPPRGFIGDAFGIGLEKQ